MDQPFVSLVVVVLNGEDTIGGCLDALDGLDYPKDRYEVIVVDGGSDDGTLEIAGRHRARLVTGGNIPSSRNTGVREAKGGIIGFVDSDSVLPPHWLGRGVAHFQDSTVACAGSRHVLPDGAPPLSRALAQHRGRADWLPTRACLFRKDALIRVGGFDESLDTGEDWDMGVRLHKSGYRIVDDAGMSFVHTGYPKSAGEMWRKRMWWSKNLVRLWTKDGFSLRLLPNVVYAAYYLAMVPVTLGGLTLGLMLGSPPLAVAPFVLAAAPALALAARSAVRARSISCFPAFAAVYLLWGAADAASIVKNRQMRWLAARGNKSP